MSESIRNTECELHAPEYLRRAHAIDIASAQFEPQKGNGVMRHISDGRMDGRTDRHCPRLCINCFYHSIYQLIVHQSMASLAQKCKATAFTHAKVYRTSLLPGPVSQS